MATQKEVATLAGVSFITVSRVVNGEANVRPETRRRVEEAIAELGYYPSFAGKALNSGRSDTIGVMTPARFGDGLENHYLMGVLRGIELACRERGQDILLSPLASGDPGFDFLRPYRQRKADGMVYIGLQTMSDALVAEIEDRSIPCVVVGDRPDRGSLSWVDTDNEGAGYATTRRLIELGHRRIAFMGLRSEFSNANIADRCRGFQRAMREAGLSSGEDAVIRTSYAFLDIRASFRSRFERGDSRPTALFCATDDMAAASLREAQAFGIAVPGDLSLVGFDGFLAPYHVHPTIASSVQPLVEMGRAAADAVLDRLADPSLPRAELVFPVRPLDGESVAPPAAT